MKPLIIALLVGCSTVLIVGTSACGERPHLVMLFADDMGAYAGAYAKLQPMSGDSSKRRWIAERSTTWGEVMDTPNIDALAAGGVLFRNAFVSSPSCTPCRSSLLSGQPFWRCGRASILIGAIWDGSIDSYPLMLEASGYRIGHTYKVWSPGTPADAPHGGDRTRFAAAGHRFNSFSQTVMAADVADRDAVRAELLDEVRTNVRSFLDADGDGVLDGDRPICYWLGPTNTHRQWVAGSGRELWGIDPDSLRGKLPEYLPDEPVIREDFADYLGECMAFDAAVGVAMQELRRVGIADDTLVVVSGDHGVPGVSRGKCNLYDLGTHVPLVMHWPAGIATPGRVVDDFVSLPDLAPTFLEAAGVPPSPQMTARSLLPQLRSDRSGMIDPTRDAVFSGRERHVDAARTGFLPYPQRAIRTADHLYIVNFEPGRTPMGDGPGVAASRQEMPSSDALRRDTFVAYPDMDASPTKAFIATHAGQYPQAFAAAFGLRPGRELYRITDDPDCLRNLADDPMHRDTLNHLHDRLMRELSISGDPRVGDDITFERSPLSDQVRDKLPPR